MIAYDFSFKKRSHEAVRTYLHWERFFFKSLALFKNGLNMVNVRRGFVKKNLVTWEAF